MLEGLYSAAAGMAAQQQRIDAVSNDIANVSTTGYKRTRLSFRDLAYAAQSTGNDVRAGAGAATAWASRSDVAGSIETTGQPRAMASSALILVPPPKRYGTRASCAPA